VVAFSVNRKTREIGIRMALGAQARDVRSLILRQAMLPVAIGAVIGIAGFAAVSRVLSSLLFGLSAHDAVAFLAAPAFLSGVALLASYFPARCAASLAPLTALRHE
jgi:ABC-type antimicrobial peptide transport system permease subunit